MPKKFKQHNLAQQYNGLSTQSSSSTSDTVSVSVNDRLERSRKAQLLADRNRYQKLRQQSETQRSIPPELGLLLGVPRIAPPRARVRSDWRVRLPNRTPGPPPPKSWLDQDVEVDASSSWAGSHGSRTQSLAWHTYCRHAPLSRFSALLRHDMVKPGSLMHYALRKLALEFNVTLRPDPGLARYLPPRALIALPSYVQAYGPSIVLTHRDLPIFVTCISHESGYTLDFDGMLGPRLAVKDLVRLLKHSSTAGSDPEHETTTTETWEDEYMASIAPAMPLHGLAGALTHLSLSHPQGAVSWQDLVALTSQTAGLTHISLAYWPYPAWSASTIPYEDVLVPAHDCHIRVLGRRLPEQRREARDIIRRLSVNTFNLHWLDLEGCEDWWQEIVDNCDGWPSEILSGRGEFRAPIVLPRHWPAIQDTGASASCADWASSWRQVTYLRLTQSRTLQAWPFGLPAYLSPDQEPTQFTLDNDDACRREIFKTETRLARGIAAIQHIDHDSWRGLNTPESDVWFGKEIAARHLARRCQRARRAGADGKQLADLVVDFGWPTVDLGYAGVVTSPVFQ